MKISKSSKPAGTWRRAAGCKNGGKQNGNKYEEQLSEWSEYSGGAGKCEDRELFRILQWW